jgi:hypothetical protein
MNTQLGKNWSDDWFGVWREGDYFPQCPRVEDCVDPAARLVDEERILKYLDGASVIEVYATMNPCKLCPAELPAGIMSDGLLAWTLDLPHYVREHHIVLPTRFVQRIREMNYVAPSKIDKAMQELPWPHHTGGLVNWSAIRNMRGR